MPSAPFLVSHVLKRIHVTKKTDNCIYLISSPGVQNLVSISGKLVQAPKDYNSLLKFKVLLDKEDRNEILHALNESCNAISDQACPLGLQNAKFGFCDGDRFMPVDELCPTQFPFV